MSIQHSFYSTSKIPQVKMLWYWAEEHDLKEQERKKNCMNSSWDPRIILMYSVITNSISNLCWKNWSKPSMYRSNQWSIPEQLETGLADARRFRWSFRRPEKASFKAFARASATRRRMRRRREERRRRVRKRGSSGTGKKEAVERIKPVWFFTGQTRFANTVSNYYSANFKICLFASIKT